MCNPATSDKSEIRGRTQQNPIHNTDDMSRFVHPSLTTTNNTSQSSRSSMKGEKLPNKPMGWFERIALMVDEYCCMSYTARQILQETNDVLCSNLCFAHDKKAQQPCDDSRYPSESIKVEEDNVMQDDSTSDRIGGYGDGRGVCGSCWGRKTFSSLSSRRRKRGVVVPLHIVKEDCIYYQKHDQGGKNIINNQLSSDDNKNTTELSQTGEDLELEDITLNIESYEQVTIRTEAHQISSNSLIDYDP